RADRGGPRRQLGGARRSRADRDAAPRDRRRLRAAEGADSRPAHHGRDAPRVHRRNRPARRNQGSTARDDTGRVHRPRGAARARRLKASGKPSRPRPYIRKIELLAALSAAKRDVDHSNTTYVLEHWPSPDDRPDPYERRRRKKNDSRADARPSANELKTHGRGHGTNETARTEARARLGRGRSCGSRSGDRASQSDACDPDARSRARRLRPRRVSRAAETFRALEGLRPRQGPHRRSRARNEGRQPLRRDGQTAEQLYRVPAREAAIPKPPGGLLHRGRPRAGLSCARRELGGCGRYLRARRCTPLPRGLRRALARVRDRAGTTAASRIMAAFRPRIERMPRSIDVTVAAVIERDDRFLLVEENACGKIVFNQPAGHLEPDE